MFNAFTNCIPGFIGVRRIHENREIIQRIGLRNGSFNMNNIRVFKFVWDQNHWIPARGWVFDPLLMYIIYDMLYIIIFNHSPTTLNKPWLLVVVEVVPCIVFTKWIHMHTRHTRLNHCSFQMKLPPALSLQNGLVTHLDYKWIQMECRSYL